MAGPGRAGGAAGGGRPERPAVPRQARERDGCPALLDRPVPGPARIPVRGSVVDAANRRRRRARKPRLRLVGPFPSSPLAGPCRISRLRRSATVGSDGRARCAGCCVWTSGIKAQLAKMLSCAQSDLFNNRVLSSRDHDT